MTHRLDWDGVDLAQFGAVLRPPEHLSAWRKLSGEEGVVQAGPIYDFGLTQPDAKVLQARRRTMTDVAPDLRGSWDGKTSFSLWEVGKKLFEMGRVKYADENGYLSAQRQTLGTCVSRGYSLAGNVLQFAQIANGENLEFKRVAHAVIYGGSREEGNMLAPPGNDGSYGEAAAKWVSGKGKKGGGLAYLEEIGDEYDSDKIAGQMGWKGVPKEIKELAKDNLISDYALVTSFEEAADAIFNGKPVPVCSGQGFTMERDKDGFCSPRGSWAHCMLFGSIFAQNGRRGLGCGQSWGYMTPKGPLLLGCPSYVFGVDEATVNKMLRGKDSFALAGLQGWAAQSWPMDWTF